MSELQRLITDLCPTGVPRVRIDDLIAYEQPTKYLVASKSYDDSYSTPVLTAGQSFLLGYTNEEHGKYSASIESPVIIFDDFTTAYKWVDFEFKVKSSAMKMLTLKPGAPITLRYFWYALSTIQIDTSEHARYWISKISNLEIPLPPLEIQSEIVRILDTFIKLDAELDAELETRIKQNDYYRSILLDYDEECTHKREERYQITEVFQIRNGYTPSKAKPEYWDNGTIPWIRLEDIRTFGRLLDRATQYIDKSGLRPSGAFQANSIIISTLATIGEHALVTVPFVANQQITILTIKQEFTKTLDPKFAFYYCFNLAEYCRAHTSTSGFASVNMRDFKKFTFPIPSIQVQFEVVRILDSFSDLIAELKEELEARRQQYEYFRSKLLSFNELEVA